MNIFPVSSILTGEKIKQKVIRKVFQNQLTDPALIISKNSISQVTLLPSCFEKV